MSSRNAFHKNQIHCELIHTLHLKGFSGMFVSWQKNFHGSTMVLKALFVIMIESDLLRADFVAEIGPTFLSFGSAQAVRSV